MLVFSRSIYQHEHCKIAQVSYFVHFTQFLYTFKMYEKYLGTLLQTVNIGRLYRKPRLNDHKVCRAWNNLSFLTHGRLVFLEGSAYNTYARPP